MRGLAGIRARLDKLLAAHAESNERPSTVLLLPANGRGPDSGAPYPRTRRVGKALIIVYRLEDGQPSPEAIRQLVDQSVEP